MATLAELLARATSALDERIAKARAGGYTITQQAELAYRVVNGSGVTYEVTFSQRHPTGQCTCDDFLARGHVLHACKHIAAVVLTQFPDRWDRWEAKVRAAADMAVRALPPDPEPEPAPAPVPPEPEAALEPPEPAPATASAAPDAATVQLVIELALPIIMELVMDTLAQHAAALTAKVLAELRGEGPNPNCNGGAAD